MDADVLDATVELDASMLELDASMIEPDAGMPRDAGGEPPIPPLTWVTTDSSAASGRRFLGDRVGRSVFEVSFTTTTPGEKRWVQARMNIEQYDHSGADPLMMAAVSMSCRSSDGTRDPQNGISNTQNVLRGTVLRLEPQVVFTGGSPGTYRCTVSAQGGRPRPTGSFDLTRFDVASGSYLRVSSRIHPGSAQSYSPQIASPILDDGDALDAAPLMWTAPAGVTSFRAFGAVKLTTCTSSGGSDDSHDSPDRGPLCDLPGRELDRSSVGTTVQVTFQVLQLATDGSYCRSTTIPSTASSARVLVDKDTHHEMVYRAASSVSVSTAAGCTRRFRIKTYLRQISGPSVIVHRQGTISAAIPL